MRTTLLVALAAELLLADVVAAQGRTPLKRGLPAILARPSCAPAAPARSVTAEQRRGAREPVQEPVPTVGFCHQIGLSYVS